MLFGMRNIIKTIRPLARLGAAAGVLGLTTLAVAPTASAQPVPGIIIVDVMIVNDDGGTLTNPDVTFTHTNGANALVDGTDPNVIKCLTSDGGECYINSAPIGPGVLTVPAVPGYTVAITCTTPASNERFALRTDAPTSADFTGVEFGEIFCVILLDDEAPTDTTTTTTTTTTLAPTTTVAPTTAPSTTLAVVLPATGADDSGFLALVALGLLAGGFTTMGFARRKA